MNKLNRILENYPDQQILKCDGFDECVLGYEYNFDGNIRLIYSIDKIINKLIDEGMDLDDAIDYFEFNIRDSYVGEQTPIWCQDDF